MHHRRRHRAVGAGPDHHMLVGRLRAGRAVRVDHDEMGTALLAGAGHVGHHVDLGGDRIAAPHDDQVGLRHLARVGALHIAHPGDPAGAHDGGADVRVLARIAHDIAQTVDPVAVHQAHRAGEIIRPDRLGAVPGGGLGESAGDPVQRLVPGDLAELGGTLRSGTQQRLHQPVGMVHPLGVARDLGADHPGRVVVRRRPADAADGRTVDPLHLQGAGAGAVVRADGGDGVERHGGSLAGQRAGVTGKRYQATKNARLAGNDQTLLDTSDDNRENTARISASDALLTAPSATSFWLHIQERAGSSCIAQLGNRRSVTG